MNEFQEGPVIFAPPENERILAFLSEPTRLEKSVSAAKGFASTNPDSVPNSARDLGTHPDVVSRLWQELGGVLPERCSWIVYGAPCLVHPRTGIIFGFAGGTDTYAIRLPAPMCAEAVKHGATRRRKYPPYPSLGISASELDLATFGAGWVFGAWMELEPDWCRAAYLEAARDSRQ